MNLPLDIVAKNRTPVQIADELELELSEVQKMIELIRREQATQA